jgi:rhodanese-related sulfurtransferase
MSSKTVLRIAALAVLVLAPLAGVWAQGQSDTDTEDEIVETMNADYTDPQTLVRIVEEDPSRIHLVDVRTPQEYAAGHIPTARNIEYQNIGGTPPTDDKDAPIVVYCRSGARSGRALQTLEEMGYNNVHNFGGVGSWPGDLVTGDKPTAGTD